MEHKSQSKMSRSRQPKRVTRARAAARYPIVRMAPSRVSNFRPLNILTRPPVVAIKHVARLLYNDNIAISPTGQASTAYVMSANGLYDPNISGAGHQPMGFDQLMTLYEHYTVRQGKITVNFANESATECGFVGIALFPDSSPETSYYKLVENGLLVRSFIASRVGDSKSAVQLTTPFNIAKINGRPGNITGDELYRGDVASNPTEQTYLHVFAYNPANTNTMAVRCDILIEYEAVFTEPRKLANS